MVFTKGGASYHLTHPPTLVKDTLVIGLRGGAGMKMRLDEIGWVITEDGTKHLFDGQPVVVNDAIVIKPEVDDKNEIYSGRIQHVSMKDGTRYEFDNPPIATDTAIVYDPLVRIPLSEVVQMSSGGEKDKLYMDRIQSLVTKDGTLYEFTTPPSIVRDTLIVGTAVNRPVSLPLADVASVHVSEFSYVKTGLLVLGIMAFVGTAMLANSLPTF